jgi:hypothetical protein
MNDVTRAGTAPRAMRKVEEARQDFYSGSLDELAALGFAPRDKFPGQPGRPLTTVNIRPAGVTKPKGVDYWWLMPGFVRINRTASGRYQMRVTVSEAEQRRRESAKAAKAHSDAQSFDGRAPKQHQSASEALDTLVQQFGHDAIVEILRTLRPSRPSSRRDHLTLVHSAPAWRR